MKSSTRFLITGLFFVTFGVISQSNSKFAHAASYSGTTPTALRGSYYRYAGSKKWDKLTITAHTATLSGPDYKTKTIKSSYKTAKNKLAYKRTGTISGRKYFTLQATLKDSSQSVFPGNGMSLTSHKISGKKVTVVRGYQGGYWFDFVKSHKISHDYSGNANGKY